MKRRQLLLTKAIILGVFLFSFVIPFQTHFLLAQEAESGGESFQKAFSGTLGDYPIMMRLMREEDTLSGDYLYTKYGQPIPLEGEINTEGDFRVYELSDKGIKLAEFRGRLDASTNHIEGTWTKGNTTLPFKAYITTLQTYKESKAAWKIDLANPPTTADVVVKLEYDVGGYGAWGGDDNRVFLKGGEKFLVLPVTSSWDLRHSIFQSQGTHWYGGTPVIIGKSKKQYTLSYIGFKINGVNSLGDLIVEIAVDFAADRSGFLNTPKKGWWAQLLNLVITKTYACGPSMYVRIVGITKLSFFKETNGIRWYELTTPIPLYNLSSAYCDEDDIKEMMKEEGISEEEAQVYCPKLINGEIRMHIDYIPKMPGQLLVEVAAIVVKDENGDYCQVKLVKGATDAYRAYLVPVEKGTVQYIYDDKTTELMIELKNTGQSPIHLDEVSLSALARSGTYGEGLLDRFSLDDEKGKPIRMLSFQEIQNRLNGETILPEQSLRVPLFSISTLPAQVIYCPMIGLARATTKYKAPKTQGRIIHWSAPHCNYPRRLINGQIKRFLSIDNNNFLFYVNDDSSVDFVKLQKEGNPSQAAGRIQYLQMLPVADSWIYKTTFPASKFKYRQARLNDVPGFEWGLFLKESSTQYLRKATGVSIISRGRDYYGNNLTYYKRGDVRGFIVDRSFKCPYTTKICAQSVLYEIPSEWTNDKKLMAYLLWMIRMNAIYPS